MDGGTGVDGGGGGTTVDRYLKEHGRFWVVKRVMNDGE